MADDETVPVAEEGEAEKTSEENAEEAPKTEAPDVATDEDENTSVAAVLETDKAGSDENPKLENANEPMPLFDSKGSLLETESFVRGRLQEWKQRRDEVASTIADLQAKFKSFKEKFSPTDDDISSLNKYHVNFLEKMGEYEELTMKLERMMGMSEAPSTQIKAHDLETAPEQSFRELSKATTNIEQKLPKVVVCGTDMEDSMPRIIVCEPLKREHTEPFYDRESSDKGTYRNCEELVKEQLREDNKLLETLATQNHETRQISVQLQQEIVAKKEQMEKVKQRLLRYEAENCRIQRENCELQRRLMMSRQKQGGGKICKRELYMQFRGQPPEGI